MDYINLSKNIKGIIFNYLTISKNEVLRNKKLTLFNLQNYPLNPKNKILYCHCIICDAPTMLFDDIEYGLDFLFNKSNLNINIITNNSYFCNDCYMTAFDKFDLNLNFK